MKAKPLKYTVFFEAPGSLSTKLLQDEIIRSTLKQTNIQEYIFDSSNAVLGMAYAPPP